MLWVLTGTRPDIIKLAPVCWELDQHNVPYLWIHSGQHYDDKMAQNVFDFVMGRRPDFALSPLKASTPAEKIAKIKTGLKGLSASCSYMIVQGDTLTALAGVLFAREQGIPTIHVEAGLRSGDIRTPEELIRISIDNLSNLLLAPTSRSIDNIRSEDISGKHVLVGNTIVDAVNNMISKHGYVDLTQYQWSDRFILLTLHRVETLSNLVSVEELFKSLRKLVWCGYQVVFPIHPHTQQVFATSTVSYRNLLATMPPQDYRTFLSMVAHAKLVITDSGSLQEEAYLLGTPCVTIRASTERPETVEARANTLVDISKLSASKIEHAISMALASPRDWSRDAYGNGASTRIVETLSTEYGI